MLIHDRCNWPFDLFAFWGIVSLDKKPWNICLLVWVISSLVGRSYVDLDLFYWTVLSLEHWNYVNLSSPRVELFKHRSNIETFVWIVAFSKDWYDWYFLRLLLEQIAQMVFSENLSYIYLLVWIISLFENWPNVFFHLFFVPLNVELSNVDNFWLLIELCVKVRNIGLVRESIVVIENI